ncbi:MAG: AbrB/MazE/SpoVT family DNA-binding domain-containing protein [Euryarchaeota archaeon]|nr:AbrB/MazE/SpoVT family DNA-binding domain-containing protein [Euryarchaeota archaeon]
MEEATVEVRRWGNSLGVIIPAEAARREGIGPKDEVLIRVTKVRRPAAGSFGSLRGWAMDAQRFKDELRREHES